mgnify:CR=1 FL=1
MADELRDLRQRVGDKMADADASLPSGTRKREEQATETLGVEGSTAESATEIKGKTKGVVGEQEDGENRADDDAAGFPCAKKTRHRAPENIATSYPDQIVALGRAQSDGDRWTTSLPLQQINDGLVSMFNRRDSGPFRLFVVKALYVRLFCLNCCPPVSYPVVYQAMSTRVHVYSSVR